MAVFSQLARGGTLYLQQLRKFNRNIWLLLAASILGNFAAGIFGIDFNLYILSRGIHTDTLGGILSATPVAQILAAIPIGFFAERLGYRKAFLVIYIVSGLALLGQVTAPSTLLIALSAFLYGLAISGNFVVRLPYLIANLNGSDRNYVFSFDSVLSSLLYALGALLAGFLPGLLGGISSDLTVRYQITLVLSGLLMLASSIPIFLIHDRTHHEKQGKISLSPYLWGMDRFTVKAASIEFFIGLTMGLIIPFMNIVFVYHLGTSREYFGAVEALAFIPITLVTVLGPVLASRVGSFRAIFWIRFLIPISTLVLGITLRPFVGAQFYWAYKALFYSSQAIWFGYAMATSTPKAKAALSAWLEITFQMGMALAAPLTGFFLNQENYGLPFYIATTSAVIVSILTYYFLGTRNLKMVEETVEVR